MARASIMHQSTGDCVTEAASDPWSLNIEEYKGSPPWQQTTNTPKSALSA